MTSLSLQMHNYAVLSRILFCRISLTFLGKINIAQTLFVYFFSSYCMSEHSISWEEPLVITGPTAKKQVLVLIIRIGVITVSGTKISDLLDQLCAKPSQLVQFGSILVNWLIFQSILVDIRRDHYRQWLSRTRVNLL